jgi:hypothetical protein
LAVAKQREEQPEIYKANIAATTPADGQRRGAKERSMTRVFIEEAVTFATVTRIMGRRLLGQKCFEKWYKDVHEYTVDEAADAAKAPSAGHCSGRAALRVDQALFYHLL